MFTFKRNVNDYKTIDSFVGVKVDGVELPRDGYTAVAGSVVVTLSPAYLETLSVGDHELTAMFADGDDVTVGFKILEASSSNAADKGDGSNDASAKTSSAKASTVKTGDTSAMLVILLSVAASLALFLMALSIRKRRGKANASSTRGDDQR